MPRPGELGHAPKTGLSPTVTKQRSALDDRYKPLAPAPIAKLRDMASKAPVAALRKPGDKSKAREPVASGANQKHNAGIVASLEADKRFSNPDENSTGTEDGSASAMVGADVKPIMRDRSKTDGFATGPGADPSEKYGKSRSYAFAVASGIAMLLSVLLLVASFYTLNAVREIRSIRAELDTLNEFETRIVDRLDSYNTGVQSITETTNNRLSVLQSQVDRIIEQQQLQAGPLRSGAGSGAGREVGNEIVDPYDLGAPGTETEKGFPGHPAVTTVTGSNAKYRRIAAPDGSVTYEKIR